MLLNVQVFAMQDFCWLAEQDSLHSYYYDIDPLDNHMDEKKKRKEKETNQPTTHTCLFIIFYD